MAKGKKKKRKEKKQAPAPKSADPNEAPPAAKPADPNQTPPVDPEKPSQAPATETADSEKPAPTPPLEASKPGEATPGEATPPESEKPSKAPAPESAAPKPASPGPAPAGQPGQPKQPKQGKPPKQSKQDKPSAPKRAEAAAATPAAAAPTAFHPLLTPPGAARPWGREDALPLVLLAALAAVLLWGPFLRGLYFDTEMLVAMTATFALFTVWCGRRWFRGEHGWLSRPLDWALLLLVVLYFLSFLTVAVDKRAALLEFFRMASYFAIYLMVYDLARQRDRGPLYLNIILHLLLFSGLAVALGGLGTAAGTWEIDGAVTGRRIYTSLQYPNTAGAYLLAAYFLSLGLGLLCTRARLRPLYAVPATILLIVFAFTFSRGAWVLMPPLALLFLLLLGRAHITRALGYLAGTGLAAGLALVPLDNAIRDEASAHVWLLALGAALLAAAVSTAGESLPRLSPRGRLATGGGVLAALILGAVLLGPTVGPHLARPLALATAADAEASDQYLEQRVERLAPGQEHTLTLEVNAYQGGGASPEATAEGQGDEPAADQNAEPAPGEAALAGEDPTQPAAADEASGDPAAPGDPAEAGEQAEEDAAYAWRVRVSGFDFDDESHTLLDETGGITDGWEEQSFTFRPDTSIQRLQVRLYNGDPGTGFAARNVTLASPEREASLGFTLHRWLPERIYGRLAAIGTGERDAQSRLTFIADATAIARDYPLLGTGGGGWAALYPLYQEEDYSTREVHSHPFQVWVETGTPGLLALLGAWVLFGWALLRGVFRTRNPAPRALAATLLAAAATLGTHSFIDFNFSLGIISIFFFALLGAGRSQEEWHPQLPERWQRRLSSSLPAWSGTAALLVLAVVLTFSAFRLTDGHFMGNRAAALVEQDQLEEAIPIFEGAVARDPYRAASRSALANLYEYAAGLEANAPIAPQLQAEALEHRREAHQLQPYNVQYTGEYATALLRAGEIEKSVELAHQLIELRPQDRNSYLQAAEVRLAAAEHLQAQGQQEAAAEHLQAVYDLEPALARVQEDTAALATHLGRAHYLAGDWQEALAYLEQVEENDELWGTALVYRSAVLQALDRGDEAAGLLDELPGEEEEELRALYERLLEEQ